MQVENSRMIYRGSGELARVYRGTTIVWEPGELTYDKQYLTFTVEGSTEGLFCYANGSSISISKNNGPWKIYSSGIVPSGSTSYATIADRTVSQGDTIRVRRFANVGRADYSGATMYISGGTEYNVSGNILSLIYSSGFRNYSSFPGSGYTLGQLTAEAVDGLFTGGNVISAENLYIPQGGQCFGLFSKCTTLETAPSVLPRGDYGLMFRGCTSLVNAPQLPATTLDTWCYYGMFSGCTSLVNAPALPATTLAIECYAVMFKDCVSLVSAPVLPATTLESGCYTAMFMGCTSLNYIKCLATDISAGNCTNGWVYNVAPTGTFIKDHNMNDWEIDSNDGIPIGWTVIDAS